ncbi:DNA alkylation repair protein [Nostoc ellipsosporum NOK]|nr:DNA alkylation repair protein [Nostoc ellipsosporum NOK]
MTANDVLKKLASLANPATLKHNLKAGAGENQFGVKMGDIRKVAASIKADHALAIELWATGNIDARFVAILILKPKELSATALEDMVKSETFTQVADWLYSYVIKEFPGKEKLREKWMKSKDKMCARAGWSLTSGRVARDPEGIDIPALLDRLEKEMPKAPPEVQWTMNNTLANIGIHHPAHRQRALAIGEKLGIYKDYPVSKGCTSPYAPIWINEMVKRQK